MERPCQLHLTYHMMRFFEYYCVSYKLAHDKRFDKQELMSRLAQYAKLMLIESKELKFSIWLFCMFLYRIFHIFSKNMCIILIDFTTINI